MRSVSQSLQGDVKDWFKHLHPKSINTWEEFHDMFLKFQGKRRSIDQILSEFYSMERQEDETMPSFNMRFSSFDYKMPKEIQPFENAAKLYYASTFSPKLSMLLLERQPITLQQMFVVSLEVEDNLRMSKKLSN